jgi:hypothetical protein
VNVVSTAGDSCGGAPPSAAPSVASHANVVVEVGHRQPRVPRSGPGATVVARRHLHRRPEVDTGDRRGEPGRQRRLEPNRTERWRWDGEHDVAADQHITPGDLDADLAGRPADGHDRGRGAHLPTIGDQTLDHRVDERRVAASDTHRLLVTIGADRLLLCEEQQGQLAQVAVVTRAEIGFDDEPGERVQVERGNEGAGVATVEFLGAAPPGEVARVGVADQRRDRVVRPPVVDADESAGLRQRHRTRAPGSARQDQRVRLAVDEPALCRQPELVDPRQDPIVAVVDRFAAALGQERPPVRVGTEHAVGLVAGAAERPHATPDPVASLDDDDVPARPTKGDRGGETGEPGPDHHHTIAAGSVDPTGTGAVRRRRTTVGTVGRAGAPGDRQSRPCSEEAAAIDGHASGSRPSASNAVRFAHR